MKDEYYAHSVDGKPPQDWQSLKEHLKNVAEMARTFAESFGAADWGYLAGLWHDLGKYSPDFQLKIHAVNGLHVSGETRPGRVNHSTAGALLAVEKFREAGRIFAYMIAGHHAGLPDWEGDETGNAALSRRIKDKELLE